MWFWITMGLSFIGTCALLEVIKTSVERRVRNRDDEWMRRFREKENQKLHDQNVEDLLKWTEELRARLEYNRRQQERVRAQVREQVRTQHTRTRQTIHVRTTMTIEGADRLLASYGGYREAVKKTHPDCGGSAQAFRQVQEAKEILDRHKKGLI